MDETARPPKRVTCPQCSSLLDVDSRYCPNCGIDLALFFLLDEKSRIDPILDGPEQAATPEWLVPRIGEYLLEENLLSQEQLEHALMKQKEAAAQGERQLLGQTLVRLGYVDRDTLDNAITKQIIELHSALQESNRTLEMKVTERTIELRNALERLSELNQIKANLISNISHELRTPLAHIRGYIELLADGQIGKLSDEQMDALKVVRKATERLSNLIEELIEFSTASREGLSLHLAVTPIEELFSNVIERSSEKAEAAGVDLKSNPGENNVAVNVDPERLSWVIYQLVDNGIKFTPAGGMVSITASNDNATTKITISDTGIGIPEGGLDEIFEPFHQLDGSATRRYGGTGLGLSLVNLILEAHGTTLHVASAEGQGSTFWFNLPIAA